MTLIPDISFVRFIEMNVLQLTNSQLYFEVIYEKTRWVGLN